MCVSIVSTIVSNEKGTLYIWIKEVRKRMNSPIRYVTLFHSLESPQCLHVHTYLPLPPPPLTYTALFVSH